MQVDIETEGDYEEIGKLYLISAAQRKELSKKRL